MANRVLRDWTTSDAVELLSAEAEVFFTRLIMKADDYGSYYANTKLLKAALFPLKDYSDSRIKQFIAECVEAELVFLYSVDGKDYIRIVNFGQRLRNMRNVFPHPVDGSRQLAATRGNSRPETKRNETESETETNTMDEVVELSLEISKVASDLTNSLCKFFSVKTDVMSPIYDTVCDYAECMSNQNKLESAKHAFAEYSIYKARSQEKIHNIASWIGTKEKHYQDGQWATIDWSSKNKNYNGITSNKGISGQGGPEAGKDYSGGF